MLVYQLLSPFLSLFLFLVFWGKISLCNTHTPPGWPLTPRNPPASASCVCVSIYRHEPPLMACPPYLFVSPFLNILGQKQSHSFGTGTPGLPVSNPQMSPQRYPSPLCSGWACGLGHSAAFESSMNTRVFLAFLYLVSTVTTSWSWGLVVSVAMVAWPCHQPGVFLLWIQLESHVCP